MNRQKELVNALIVFLSVDNLLKWKCTGCYSETKHSDLQSLWLAFLSTLAVVVPFCKAQIFYLMLL